MQRAVNSFQKIICILGIIAAAWFVLSAFGRQAFRAVFRLPDFSMENRSETKFTSTNFRYQEEFQSTLKKYTRFQKLYREDISTAVPGLNITRVGDGYCSQMVPQGICIAGDYMLITAYDNGRNVVESEDYRTKNSVIYVLDNKDIYNRRFLTTIVLPDINHAGGIAFDGKNVWIAKSTAQKCSALDYRMIQKAVRSGKESYTVDAYTAEADCGVTASFITYYDNKLWVGTFRSRISGSGSLRSFEIEEADGAYRFLPKEKLSIPSYANGVTFAEVDGRTCMAVTSSCGRYGDSRVYLYEVVHSGENADYIYQAVYSFPPMAEELVSDGEHTYFLFESAATCYSQINYRKCSYPVDRVCGVSTEELFYWAGNALFKGSAADRSGFESEIDYAYFDPQKYMRIKAMKIAGQVCSHLPIR